MDILKEVYKRILILDGAYGTQLQALGLDEAATRGKWLREHPVALQGNHDLLNLTQPEAVMQVHRSYVQGGADILKTNTFNSTSISQADYRLAERAQQLALEGARLARRVADEAPRKVWVAGSVGPTNKTLSMSPDVAAPGYRAIAWRVLEQAYWEQIAALDEGGVDIILIETIFDTLNAKAAIHAYRRFYEKQLVKKPLWLSVTVTDKSGRTLSGQTLEAWWNTVAWAQPWAVGINCALGAAQMWPYVREMNRWVSCGVSLHPNAGLPNELGGYDDTPENMSQVMGDMAREGLLNIAGGCCGTTAEHIAAIAQQVAPHSPRVPPVVPPALRLSGLEALTLPAAGAPFLLIGERTNVTGSPAFAQAVRAGDMTAALKIAVEQVRSGANLLDVNFDEGLLDGPALMRDFVNLVASEPEIARVPLVLDSSSMEVLEAGLKCAQGKVIVNSLSLKDGEAKFLENARRVRGWGAAAVVMAFDEEGQAADVPRRLQIAQRAYRLLTQDGFPPEDIIFDLNILTIGTGMPEHASYAKDFLEALPLVKAACPGVRMSGGVSNLSFAFRGQKKIREALHSVFLYHAIRAGLDMAIVNAALLIPYEEIEPELRQLCEDLVWNRSATATEALLGYAQGKGMQASVTKAKVPLAWRSHDVEERLGWALMNGVSDWLEVDIKEALEACGTPLKVIEGPLMAGMRRIGDLFGEGKMFLPQVVKAARVMKQCVAILEPQLKAAAQEGRPQGKVLLATVKGDVHDIGKNIVGVVLACNGYQVIDLGVMVPWEKILRAIQEEKPDIVGFSGLITPSLGEMVYNAQQMKKEGLRLPLLIGGATTSRLHTALKIAPEYFSAAAPVVYVPDASRVVEVCQKLLSPEARPAYIEELQASNEALRAEYAGRGQAGAVPLAQARQRAPVLTAAPRVPARYGVQVLDDVPLAMLIEHIDWSPFFWAWGIKGLYPKVLAHPEAQQLFDDAQKVLQAMGASRRLRPRGVIGLWRAWRKGDDVVVRDDEGHQETFHFLRQQHPSGTAQVFMSLADFVATPEVPDSLGGFVVTAGEAVDVIAQEFTAQGDDYSAIIAKALGDRLAEAFAEVAHARVRRMWGQEPAAGRPLGDLLEEKYPGIRPASGYPACPDHSQKRELWRLLSAEENTGARLTQTCAMWPASTVSGLYFHHPQARYFSMGKIGEDQLADYAARKGWSLDEARRWLAAVL